MILTVKKYVLFLLFVFIAYLIISQKYIGCYYIKKISSEIKKFKNFKDKLKDKR